jgi:hypothetical protein
VDIRYENAVPLFLEVCYALRSIRLQVRVKEKEMKGIWCQSERKIAHILQRTCHTNESESSTRIRHATHTVDIGSRPWSAFYSNIYKTFSVATADTSLFTGHNTMHIIIIMIQPMTDSNGNKAIEGRISCTLHHLLANSYIPVLEVSATSASPSRSSSPPSAT